MYRIVGQIRNIFHVIYLGILKNIMKVTLKYTKSKCYLINKKKVSLILLYCKQSVLRLAGGKQLANCSPNNYGDNR